MVRTKKWPSKEVAAARDHRRPAQAPAGALLPEVSRAYLRAYRVMELHEYLGSFAAQLIDELRPILEIKGVTANTDLLGKYTEAAVRNLVRRIVYPMRLSTGAVLDYPMPIPLRQIDIIVWAPFPAPALFDVQGFGLVPKSSAFGVIEVKRSNYRRVVEELETFLADAQARKIVSEPVGPDAVSHW